MVAPISLILRFLPAKVLQLRTVLSHIPVSHPSKGIIRAISAIFPLPEWLPSQEAVGSMNPSAQAAPTMVPMRRPLRGARRYCCSMVVSSWVVIVVPSWCGGRRRLLHRCGWCRSGLGWRWWGNCLKLTTIR